MVIPMTETALAIVHDSVQPYRRPLFDALNEKYETGFFLGDQQTAPADYRTQGWDGDTLIRALRGGAFDVVIAPEYIQSAAWKTYLGARLGRTPVIQWTERWDTPAWTWRTRLASLGLLRIVDKTVEAYIVPGTAHARFVAQNSARNVDEIHIAPNTTHFSISESEISTNPDTPPTVLYFGQVIPRKGIDVLVEAMGDIEQEVELMICGGGDEDFRRSLKQRAKELDVSLTMEGWVPEEDVADLYSQADIYAILSREDPAPISVVEAMQAQTPVVVSESVGCAEDLVRGKGTGYVVPTESQQSTTAALKRLLDPQRREKMSERARQMGTTIATTERMIETFDDAIVSVEG
jgi:glycosyltransferase involved in cell wall biosynthesis